MKKIEIFGENRFEKWTKSRTACRGLIIRDGKILVTYETKNDNRLMIPGGGLETDESEKECCIRELSEETGFIVEPSDCVLEIDEYYDDAKYISLYFICKIRGKTQKKLTEQETGVGMEIRWFPVEQVVEAFSKHQEYAQTDEMRRGLYLREYSALREILPMLEQKEDDILTSIVNKEGIVVRWPTKKNEKLAVLEYLKTKFEPGKIYKEREVNEILKKWHSFNDHALLRRELYDNFMINRTPDNSEYWI